MLYKPLQCELDYKKISQTSFLNILLLELLIHRLVNKYKYYDLNKNSHTALLLIQNSFPNHLLKVIHRYL